MSDTATRTRLTFVEAAADIAAAHAAVIELCGTTRGACELGAELLAQALVLRGYAPEVIDGFYESGVCPPEEHCWVRCDELDLDPTCDQFAGDILAEGEGCYSGGGDEDEEGNEILLHGYAPSSENATFLLRRFSHTPERRQTAGAIAARYRLPWPPAPLP